DPGTMNRRRLSGPASTTAPAATPPPRSPTRNYRSSPDQARRPRHYDPLRKPAALRRPVELGQYTSIDYSQTLEDHGLLASVGSVGDAYDNALAEFGATVCTGPSGTA